jgi:hypothetical protein
METKKIIAILKKMCAFSPEKRRKRIANYDVETLERFAIILYNEPLKNQARQHTLDILDSVLRERALKINGNFEWSEENRCRLLKANNALMESFESAHKEAVRTAGELETRIRNNDPFVKDYEIEITITPYPYIAAVAADEKIISYDIGDVLADPLSGYYPINHHISHCHYDNNINEAPIYLDKSMNWNIEYFGDAFEHEYISYTVHALLDTHIWSFQDIITINKIFADVKVYHQYFIKNIQGVNDAFDLPFDK